MLPYSLSSTYALTPTAFSFYLLTEALHYIQLHPLALLMNENKYHPSSFFQKSLFKNSSHLKLAWGRTTQKRSPQISPLAIKLRIIELRLLLRSSSSRTDKQHSSQKSFPDPCNFPPMIQPHIIPHSACALVNMEDPWSMSIL